MSKEVVREQLGLTIKRKTGRVRSLKKEEAILRTEVSELAQKRKAIEVEVEALEAHLESLGGPLEVAAEEPRPGSNTH